MSVFLVTDDGDDDIQIPKYKHFYQQIKELEYNFSSIEYSLSIVRKSTKYYCRRRYRPQQCLVKHLLTYMFTLLFLLNHLHWSIMVLSLSSIKFMSTYASPTPTYSPELSPSIITEDEQQCLTTDGFNIERLCSRTCRAQKNPFEKLDNMNRLLLNTHYLSFCSSYTLDRSINRTKFFNEMTENECRQVLNQLIEYDKEARKASELFATYMQALDSASDENRYSIIKSDCLKAYQTWTCAAKIPYFYQDHLIPPCQTICDEVERVCPTFRPSDREPLFAGQPLFLCNGGVVTNSDYDQPPYCFNTCHLADGSFQNHSDLSSSSSSIQLSSIETNEVYSTRQSCSQIELLSTSSYKQSSLPLLINDSISNDTNNTSIPSSAISITSSVESFVIVNSLTFIFIFLLSL